MTGLRPLQRYNRSPAAVSTTASGWRGMAGTYGGLSPPDRVPASELATRRLPVNGRDRSASAEETSRGFSRASRRGNYGVGVSSAFNTTVCTWHVPASTRTFDWLQAA